MSLLVVLEIYPFNIVTLQANLLINAIYHSYFKQVTMYLESELFYYEDQSSKKFSDINLYKCFSKSDSQY